MVNNLETWFEEVTTEVKEFEYLKKEQNKIKLEKVDFAGVTYSTTVSLDSLFVIGNYFAIFLIATIHILLFVIPLYYFIHFSIDRLIINLGSPLSIRYIIKLLGIYFIPLFFLFSFYYLRKQGFANRKIGEEYENYDFVIFTSSKKNLAHELGHIYLHRDWLLNYKLTKGFRNGFKFFFKNIKKDSEIDDLLSRYGLNEYGFFISYYKTVKKIFNTLSNLFT